MDHHATILLCNTFLSFPRNMLVLEDYLVPLICELPDFEFCDFGYVRNNQLIRRFVLQFSLCAFIYQGHHPQFMAMGGEGDLSWLLSVSVSRPDFMDWFPFSPHIFGETDGQFRYI